MAKMWEFKLYPGRPESGVLLWLLLCFGLTTDITAKAIDANIAEDDSDLFGGYLPHVLIASVASVVSAIIVIMGCAGLCDREATFKDFENEDSFVVEAPPPGPAGEFSMYPPAESTPDPLAGSAAVYFEPLPDITKLKPRVSNATVLRPKVGVAMAGGGRGLDREDSDDGFDEFAPPRDNIQDKMKLQALVSNSRHLLPRSQLQYIKELGTGYFGKVLQGEGQRILPGHKKTKVVIQMLNEESDPQDQLTFLQEAAPYREVDHPNVLKVLGQCVETTPYLVVLELCPFGDLKTYLRSHRVAIDSFNEKGLLLKFASDMAAGLQALHQHNYVHHDFATRNCLLSSDLTVKVGDYGLSEENFKEDYYFDGNGDPVPIRWLAPESLHICQDGSLAVRNITKEANVWSYGVALWEVVQFGALPYSDLSNEHVLRLVVKQHIIHLSKPDMPIAHMDRLYQLMQLCWNRQASARPSLRELRIMLLHLLSRKRNSEDDAFEQKWNQLLPRQPPKASRADSQSDPISTVSHQGLATATTSQPPVSGFESNFVELDASLLAQQQSQQQAPGASTTTSLTLEEELANAMQTHPERALTNELSLEAELSAAMQQTDGTTPTLEQELSAAAAEPGDQSPGSEGTLQADGATIIVTDHSVPDIVATSTIKTPPATSPDFMTSTPKPDSERTRSGSGRSATFHTAADGGSNLESNGTVEGSGQQSSSQYQTAMSSQSNSLGGGEEDDGSLLGQKKFAAILQTVAAPSFDGDEYDVLSSSFGSSLDRSIDEVFNELNSSAPNSGNYQKVPTDDSRPAAGSATPTSGTNGASGEPIIAPGISEQADSLLANLNGDTVPEAENKV